jgi:hypothetical protein
MFETGRGTIGALRRAPVTHFPAPVTPSLARYGDGIVLVGGGFAFLVVRKLSLLDGGVR